VTADRHTAEQAPGKPLSAPVSASTPEVGVSGGSTPLNEPQTGAQRFRDEPKPRGPVDWARQQAAEREKQTEKRLRLAHQARRAKEHQLDDIRRALCDIGFMEDDDPYSHADLADVIRQNGQGLRDMAQSTPAHNAGPSVAEAARDDRRWWNGEKTGE
jgi:hypothetical protein